MNNSKLENQDFIGSSKYDLPTPALVLNLDKAERNIGLLAERFKGRRCKLRPHAKTHKSPYLARCQIKAGAIGITCAKLEDAAGFVKAGIKNVLIAHQIVDPIKIEFAVSLSQMAELILCIDSPANAEAISQIAKSKGIRQPVLVEIDIGLGRSGVAPGRPALNFIRQVTKLPGIQFRGLMGYEGGLFNLTKTEKETECRRRLERLSATRALLEDNGIEVQTVSSGGSNTIELTGLNPSVTDIQPGSYVTMDTWNARHGMPFEQAVTVLGTVVSLPRSGFAVTDTGLKALSTDHGLPEITDRPALAIESLNEEHGRICFDKSAETLRIGDRIEFTPSHGCTTIPLFRQYWAVREDRVVEKMELVSNSASY
jgi:D-serine deaminase-like pyridoxal phosphate-dependent protein